MKVLALKWLGFYSASATTRSLSENSVCVATVTRRDWELRRHPSLALREYIPGNLIYANGHRFIPRYFRLEPGEPVRFLVDVSNEAVAEVVGNLTAGLG